MKKYVDLLCKIKLNSADKHMTNYLLLDNFTDKNSELVNIYKILISKYDNLEAYEIIICCLHAINVYIHQLNDICSKTIFIKHKDKLKEERLYYVNIYRDLTDEELIKFIRFIFNKNYDKITCLIYFDFISQSTLPFDQTLKENVDDFLDNNKIEIHNYMEMDSKGGLKRPRKCISVNTAASNDFDSIDFYKISKDRENFCLVFNNSDRNGSEKDVDKIKDTFSPMKGFTVKVEELDSREKFFQDLIRYRQLNSYKSDMIVCFFLAHGAEGVIYDKQGKIIHQVEIEVEFSATNAPTLAGKPKIFMYQACRGDQMQQVIEFDSPPPQNGIPITSNVQKPPSGQYIDRNDVFIVYASIPGHKAMRDPNTGSWFIQSICEHIKYFSKKLSLDKICTRVNNQYLVLEGDDKKLETQLCEIRKYTMKYDIYLEKPEL